MCDKNGKQTKLLMVFDLKETISFTKTFTNPNNSRGLREICQNEMISLVLMVGECCGCHKRVSSQDTWDPMRSFQFKFQFMLHCFKTTKKTQKMIKCIENNII